MDSTLNLPVPKTNCSQLFEQSAGFLARTSKSYPENTRHQSEETRKQKITPNVEKLTLVSKINLSAEIEDILPSRCFFCY